MNAKQIQALRNEMADLDRSTWFGALQMLVEKDILDTSEVRQVLGINPSDDTTKPFDEHSDDCRDCRFLNVQLRTLTKHYHCDKCEGRIVQRAYDDNTPPQPSWFPGVPKDCKEL